MTEAEHVFRCFLPGSAPSPALMRGYESALEALGIAPDPVTTRLVAARADLASAELALRRRDPGNGLTKRALVMMALAEAQPEYASRFAPRGASKMRAWSDLLIAPLAAGLQLCKGTVIVGRHVRGR